MARNEFNRCVGREMKGERGGKAAFKRAVAKCSASHGRTRSGKRRSRKGGR